LQSFFAVGDEAARRYLEYRDTPMGAMGLRQKAQQRLFEAIARAIRLLDLSEVAPVARWELGTDAYILLKEVLLRIELPPVEAIPDAAAYADLDDKKAARWTIPHTEITIARVEEGPRLGEFLFTPDTVARAREFYNRTRDLPSRRKHPVQMPHRMTLEFAGWLIPPAWAAAAPAWAKAVVFGQVLWKWLALALLLLLVFGAAALLHRWMVWARRDKSCGAYLCRLLVPVSVLILIPLVDYLLTYQINVTGAGAWVLVFLVKSVYCLAGVWAIWLIALAVAEGIIASPKIAPESLDAHLLRLAARVLGTGAAIVILFYSGNQLGIPLYGLVAGLGVGGLAIALAAQNTVENFIGSLNVYADRPVRVGELCRYGGAIGFVEEIGLRSTRIRGLDRTVTTIPNADFSKMQIINLTRRDRILLRTTLGLRYETSDEQLRFVLTKLRELLVAHPRITDSPVRARFKGYGDSSLNVEIYAYVNTRDYNEFLAIKEDVLLQMKNIVEEAGTGFAFPSRMVYQAQDNGLDPERTQAAEAEVEAWRAAHDLPFPEFGKERLERLRDTLDYPPDGSPLALSHLVEQRDQDREQT
jgi:MscS family membrane protein